jgi:hypothetical protein
MGKTMPALSKTIITSALALAIAGCLIASPARADQLVTYNWTTTNVGFGFNNFAPTSASFQVPLIDVQNGVIPQIDVTNIQLVYPGLTLDTAFASSIGLDAAAFVDPITGAFIYHDPDQGLAVISFDSSDPFFSTFLSITVDNRFGPFGNPLTSVADQYNALNHGAPDAGFPTAGFWTASFPSIGPAVPEPSSWAMLLIGLGALGLIGHMQTRRRSIAV